MWIKKIAAVLLSTAAKFCFKSQNLFYCDIDAKPVNKAEVGSRAD
jgi:hypothetical protein